QPVVDAVDGGAPAPGVGELAQLLQRRILAATQGSLQQLLPAREKYGVVVQLDIEQVGGGETGACVQVVANLPGACAQVVAAVAEQGQRRIVDGAVVGRPQPAIGGLL